jgi:hypothetical protein
LALATRSNSGSGLSGADGANHEGHETCTATREESPLVAGERHRAADREAARRAQGLIARQCLADLAFNIFHGQYMGASLEHELQEAFGNQRQSALLRVHHIPVRQDRETGDR